MRFNNFILIRGVSRSLNNNISIANSISTSAVLKASAKKTPLYDFHVANGGKMVEFAGYSMPVQYNDQSIQDAHLHTRNKCSLFDVSHMMQTRVYGKDRYRFIELLVVSDIQELQPNTGTLTLFTNDSGGVIDDLIVNNTTDGYLYIVSNAGCAEKDLKHLRNCEIKCQFNDVKLELVQDYSLLALQGPAMMNVLQPGVSFDLKNLSFMNTIKTTVYSVENCRVTRCGYTGEDGVEISVPNNYVSELAEKLLKVKDPKTNETICRLAGLGTRDTLRLEAGLCLYGNELNEFISPIEAGLAWTIGKRRRQLKDFPGAAVILNQIKEKPLKKRVGLKILNKNGPSARQHMQIFENKDMKSSIGEITSGCPSPTLNENIAMGYVRTKYSEVGTKVFVEIRKKVYEAEIVKLPFIQTKYYQAGK